MKSREPGKGTAVPRWAVWLALLAWIGCLAVWTLRANALGLSAETLHSWAALTAWTRAALWHAGKLLVGFLPVGFLSVFCLPPRASWLDRSVRRWIPALAISFLLAALVRALHTRPATTDPFVAPGMLGLLLPWTGCLLGTWAGMAWAKGMVARILFLPKVALLIVLLAGAARAIFHMAIEPSPNTIDMPSVTSADRRHLYDVFMGQNPFKIRDGRTVTLRLSVHDLNLLVAWGLAVQGWPLRAHIGIEGSQGQVLASVPMHGGSQFINVTLHGTASARDGKLDLLADRLRIGHLEIPQAILRLLSPVVARAMAGDPRLQPVVERMRSVELQSGQLALTYSQGAPAKGFVSNLFHDQAEDQIDIPAVQAQIHNLIANAPRLPRAHEARFGAALRTAFEFAREHQAPGHAVEANRAAVLALGIALGHIHVETLMGRFMDEPTRTAILSAFGGTTIRNRDDWPKHFFVSAALTLIAAGNVSDASGLLKEEKDSAGGSGFSFGDLLADRAGTTFAQVATQNEASARALQTRLAQGFKADDFFPEAKDLPEGIQEAELQTRYGGVGGEGYRRLTAEIERRIASCPAYASTR